MDRASTREKVTLKSVLVVWAQCLHYTSASLSSFQRFGDGATYLYKFLWLKHCHCSVVDPLLAIQMTVEVRGK